MSLGGGGYNSYLDNSISYAVDEGTTVFAASGNDNNNSLSYPAGYEDCIAVGAMSPCNERKNLSSCDGESYWGSNYGSDLDFMTPGVRIHTITNSGGYTSTFNGTSSACPHAAGVAGLILSVAPLMTPDQVGLVMQMIK
jgi:subtilisin family serine protease